MNTYITIYLLVGVLFNLMLDLAADAIIKNKIDTEENIRLNLGHKVFLTIIWPIGLLIFIIKLLQSEK